MPFIHTLIMTFDKSFLKFSVALILTFIQAGCAWDEGQYSELKFKERHSGKFEPITEELTGINAVSDIFPYQDYVIVVAFDAIDQTFVTVFDKDSGETVAKSVRYGRGPNEILMPTHSYFDRERGVIGFYDQMLGKDISFKIEDIIAGKPNGHEKDATNNNIHSVAGTRDGMRVEMKMPPFFKREGSPAVRLELIDSSGNVLADYDSWPEIDTDEQKYVMYQQPRMDISPDNRRMVIAPSYAGILEILSIEDEKIKDGVTRYYSKPDFNVNPKSISIEYNNGTMIFANDVYATDKYIYCAFDGETRLLNIGKDGSGKSLLVKNIAIFDWKGRELELIRTSDGIQRICVDDDNVLYAMVEDSLHRVCLARLNLKRH